MTLLKGYNVKITRPTFEIEKDLLKKGNFVIAGVDEAGRGALAGPLAVGMVIYSSGLFLENVPEFLALVDDSKKLSAKKREKALEIIMQYSEVSITTLVSHRIIDRININRATEYAVKRLLEITPLSPDIIIMDGNFSFEIGIPFVSVVKGDSKSISIASASIISKVKRDRIIERFGNIYPDYLLKKNKGYGTEAHRCALKRHGPSPIHRRTYEPVKSMLDNNR